MKTIHMVFVLLCMHLLNVHASKELKTTFEYVKKNMSVIANVETCCQKPVVNIHLIIADLSIDWKGVFKESKSIKTPLTVRTIFHAYPGVPVNMKVEIESEQKGSLRFKATLQPAYGQTESKVVFDWQTVTSDCKKKVNCDRVEDVFCNSDNVCTHSFSYKQKVVKVTAKPQACNKKPNVNVHLVVNELSIDWEKTFDSSQSVDTPLVISTFGISGSPIKMKVDLKSEHEKEMDYQVSLVPAGEDPLIAFHWRNVKSDCSDATYGWNSLGLGVQALIGIIVFTIIAIPCVVLFCKFCKRKNTSGNVIYNPMA